MRGAKAGTQGDEVWQAPGVEIRRDRLGELGLAGALVRQREQLDRDPASPAKVPCSRKTSKTRL